MDNDFNAPEVMTWMHGLVNRAYKNQEPTEMVSIADVISEICDKVFGLSFQVSEKNLANEAQINSYIAQREQAKKDRNFKLADQLREEVKKTFGVELVDSKDGTTWKRV